MITGLAAEDEEIEIIAGVDIADNRINSISSLIESASARAVPDGASSFWLWCFSTISMSNPSTARR